MASEPDVSELSSMFERMVRNRDLSLFLPFFLGLTDASQDRDPQDADEETENRSDPRDRIVLINPFSRRMMVIEGTSSVDSLLRELGRENGQPPASKASIEAMPSAEITEEGEECAICLDEWEIGGFAKEMPCKHNFHAGCIEKWLLIHGSCPVCRYKMPVDEEEVGKKIDDEGRERRVGREIWVSFSFNSDRRSTDSDHRNPSQSSSSDSNDSFLTPTSDPDLEA